MTNNIFAYVKMQGHSTPLLFVNSSPWEKHSTRKNRGKVMHFDTSFEPLHAVTGELLLSQGDRGVALLDDVSSTPIVCFAHYQDNIYLVLIGVTDFLLPLVNFLLDNFTNSLYEFPLK